MKVPPLPGSGPNIKFARWPVSLAISSPNTEVKKSRAGVLLSPQNPTDGDLLGVRLPRSALGNPVKPGRGLLHLGDGQLVSVALPRTSR